MLRLLLFLFLGCFSFHFATGQDTVHVFFGLNEDQLDEDALARISSFYKAVDGRDGLILIEGYADATGRPDYNLQLSENRALKVEARLNRLGIPDEQMQVVFYGDERSWGNDPVFKAEVFRRVDLRFFPLDEPENGSAREQALSTKAFLKLLEPRSQFIRFDNRYSRKITTKDGAMIRMDRLATRSRHEPAYRGEIILEVKEYSTPFHFLSIGMTGRTGDMFIEPKGMLFFRMYTPEEEALKIKRIKNITLSFPADTLKDNVQKFFAPLSRDGNIQWAEKRRGKRDFISLEDGLMYRESPTKRDVSNTMGIYTHNPDQLKAQQFYKSNVDAFGLVAYALPYVSSGRSKLVVSVPGWSDTMHAIAFLEDNRTLLFAERDDASQTFVFDRLPAHTTIKVIVYDLADEEAQVAFTEHSTTSATQRIQMEPAWLTGEVLRSLTKLLDMKGTLLY